MDAIVTTKKPSRRTRITGKGTYASPIQFDMTAQQKAEWQKAVATATGATGAACSECLTPFNEVPESETNGLCVVCTAGF